MPERDQVRGEVAAVDGGDVAGLERRESGCVVPVVEVPAEALQASHRGEGRLQPVHHLAGPDPSEVVGRHRREQRRARRWSARSGGRPRAEAPPGSCPREGRGSRVRRTLEESPGAPRDPAQSQRLLRRESGGRGLVRREADPSRDRRREQPEDEEGRRPGSRREIRKPRSEPRPPANPMRRRHPAREARDLQVQGPMRLRGRHPLQQMAARHGQPPERAPDRVGAKPRPRAPGGSTRRPAWARPIARSATTPRRKLRLAMPRRSGKRLTRKERTSGA